MIDSYRALVLVDDIAFRALKISLVEPERSTILNRLRDDWSTDVGVIGVLRQEQLRSGSAVDAAYLYWSSRREPTSPRIESLLASFLINLASSLTYDLLKDLIAQNYDLSKLLDVRGVTPAIVGAFTSDIPLLIAHVKTFIGLHRMKFDLNQAAELERQVARVIEKREAPVPGVDAEQVVDLLMKNLVPAVKGIVKEELERKGVFLADNTNGVLTRGLPASPGYGFGVPIRWTNDLITQPRERYVLLISDKDVQPANDVLPLMEGASAVVSWFGYMTSHVAVTCRGIGRPAVIVTPQLADMLGRKNFLVVSGTEGEIRSYHSRPE
ncbi:PEP-utilizing enzyme [Microvirga arabica]|uniref:PEP-utilizing enzyme n=1 Tax=Microvirga arabica TaxID=1128671 RepID=A0ABV6YEB8_9HYPH